MATEAVTGLMRPEAKECWFRQGVDSPGASEGSAARLMPSFRQHVADVGLLVSRTVRKSVSAALRHPVCDRLLQKP